QPFNTISTAPSWAVRWMSSCVRWPVSQGAAVSSSSRVQRSPMPLARLPCAWVWALTSPEWISLRSAEITAASSGAARPGAPISAIVSSRIRMSAGAAVPLSMSSTRPPRIIVWAMRASPTVLFILIAVEHLFDFLGEDRVEIVRHLDPRHKAQPFDLSGGRRVDGDDFHERLAGFGDDEGFALCGAIDKTREMLLHFADVDRAHGAYSQFVVAVED